MNGIAPDEAILDRMEVALAHRGQSTARYVTGGFGMVRVSMEEEASPPQSDPGGALIEIDGTSESRQTLELYRQKGNAFADELNAPFSLMLFDAAERSLILARDRFGTHPIYYIEIDEGLLFASEISTLIASGLFPPRLDRGSAEELVQLQFTCGARTPVNGVARVLAGESLVASGGRIVERHRRDMLGARQASPLSDLDALAGFERRFHAAVERSLEGCDKVTIVYGGEIEGTVLLAAARVLFKGEIRVLTPHLDDDAGRKALERAQENARALGLEVESVPLTEEIFWQNLPKFVGAVDDPAVDYAGFYLFEAARKATERAGASGGRVLLAAGADEMFAGRSRYRSVLRPLWLGGRAMRARGFMEDLGLLYEEGSGWRDAIASIQTRLASENLSILQRAQALDAADFLPNDVLTIQDRVFTHHGLQVAFPYLDDDVAGYGFWLEDRFKIAHGLGKAVLRDYLKKRFPKMDWMRRHRAPSVPVRRWISHRAHDLGAPVAYTPGVTAISPPDAVENLFLQLQDQPVKRAGNAAWQLLFFALWYKIHIEGRSPEGTVNDILAG